VDSFGGTDLSEVGGTIGTAYGPSGTTGGQKAVSLTDSDEKYLQGNPVILDGSNGLTFTCWLFIPTGAPTNAIWFWNGATFVSSITLGTSNVGPTWCFFGVENNLGETQSAGVDLGAYDTWFFVAGKYDATTKLCYMNVDNGAWIQTGDAALSVDPDWDLDYIRTNGSVRVGYPPPSTPTANVCRATVWERVLTDAEITELYTTRDIPPAVVTTTAWTASEAATGTPGYDPQVMLRLSNDGGKTWISEQWRSAGKKGEYLHRVRWNRLGAARRRVFEVSVTDPIPWKLTGAYLKMQSSKKDQ
jgi:hypothetical protein